MAENSRFELSIQLLTVAHVNVGAISDARVAFGERGFACARERKVEVVGHEIVRKATASSLRNVVTATQEIAVEYQHRCLA